MDKCQLAWQNWKSKILNQQWGKLWNNLVYTVDSRKAKNSTPPRVGLQRDAMMRQIGLKTYERHYIPYISYSLHAAGLRPLPQYSRTLEIYSLKRVKHGVSGLRGTHIQKKVGTPHCKQGSLANFTWWLLRSLKSVPLLAPRTMAALSLLSRQEVAWIFSGELAQPNRKYLKIPTSTSGISSTARSP